jgi:transcription initiation factor IIE alpha subunit
MSDAIRGWEAINDEARCPYCDQELTEHDYSVHVTACERALEEADESAPGGLQGAKR